MKKLAIILATLAVITLTLCVNYINKPDPIEKETQHVPTQVVRERDIIETRPEPITTINTYGGIAYDFEKINRIQTTK
jgi:hypothetical protein